MTLANPTPRRVALAGASGTIGSAVLRRLEADGHCVTVLARGDLTDPAVLARARAEVVISCIASRSGAPDDAQAVDCNANCALLAAAEAAGAGHFILLSAICVQKPRLAFQHAKLAFEKRLGESAIAHTIIRPTAYFKSLSGQAKRVKGGKPFLIFGDGHLTCCKPISDDDLARFIAAAIDNPAMRGKTLPIGGPGPAISLKEQGELLFRAAGRPARFTSISPRIFTIAERILRLGAPFSSWFAAKAEYARIARYYATESMLVIDPATGEYSADLTPEYGSETLESHYSRLFSGV
ncbi:NAD(P)H-binding protein [Erythrobacter neustonensis]|uniref:Divinyl chlorophyllide a 8-vinyl-reductase, chloroplastic n=1 Tax=Erythrobacter neustonensis TaxID=1112 RepID=A0A192D3T7_9SPHN|nr:NAD(P)H-binding protein [Erythrobacter neustonensis]ANK12775.1 epimerase [Erythrobacter neustonensis]